VAVQLPRRHPELDGLTIAFVTDTHVGPHFRASDLDPVVDELEKLRPDIVLFGGDFICESPRFIREIAPVVGQMAKTARLGAWGVMGNHDLANLRERVVPPLEEVGVTILANQAVAIETGHGELWVVGIDDPLLGEPDLEAAYRDVPVDAASICLWHVPDVAEDAAPFGSFLMLSGHTHGGQVRLPGIGPLATPDMGERYVQGRFQFGDMELYVSPGLGIYRPPVRFNCPPELTVIRLIASP
jgi:predicted MPP superfamily phosphohydrolase